MSDVGEQSDPLRRALSPEFPAAALALFIA
jgi:hypothetical protein